MVLLLDFQGRSLHRCGLAHTHLLLDGVRDLDLLGVGEGLLLAWRGGILGTIDR